MWGPQHDPLGGGFLAHRLLERIDDRQQCRIRRDRRPDVRDCAPHVFRTFGFQACKKFFRDSRDREAVPLISSARLGCVAAAGDLAVARNGERSEEHTSELQSLMRISYAVFCLKKNTETQVTTTHNMTAAMKPLIETHTEIN